jgi:hypothetical protein
MAAATGIRDIPGNPPSREFTITIKPQPDWEVIRLQRTQAFRGGPRDDYEVEQDSNCSEPSAGVSGFDMYQAWFGTSGDPTQTTALAMFADNGDLVDNASSHSFDAPGGPWAASMAYADPDNTSRTGVMWMTSGSGLFAEDNYTMHVELDGSPIGETYSLYAWDDVRGRWVFYRVLTANDCNENGIPDECDINCGAVGGPCDMVGCGQSTDSDGDGIPDECESGIPTVSEWGLIILTLLLLTAGTVVIGRRRRAAAV